MNQSASFKGTADRAPRTKYTREEVQAKVDKVPYWGQSIPLPHGIVTPGRVMDNFRTLEAIQLDGDLSGKRVLDIGTWDGFYSFECEKRGAQVLAIDNLNRMKRPDEVQFSHQANAGFETVKDILDSKVEFRNMDVYDIGPSLGEFDIVLFLGVLYHLKHPALALEKIAEVTRGRLVIETEWMTIPFQKRPLLEYIEADSLNQDPTNFCRPNTAWLRSVLRDLGFHRIRVLHRPLVFKSLLGSMLRRFKCEVLGRIIVEAWK